MRFVTAILAILVLSTTSQAAMLLGSYSIEATPTYFEWESTIMAWDFHELQHVDLVGWDGSPLQITVQHPQWSGTNGWLVRDDITGTQWLDDVMGGQDTPFGGRIETIQLERASTEVTVSFYGSSPEPTTGLLALLAILATTLTPRQNRARGTGNQEQNHDQVRLLQQRNRE